MKKALLIIILIAAAGAVVFLMVSPRDVAITPKDQANAEQVMGASATSLPNVPEAPQGTSTKISASAPKNSNDIGPQPQLANPPSVMKAIYLTGWVAGSPVRMQKIIAMIKSTELNSVVIDIKDYSGYVSYAMDVPGVKASGAENEIRILRPNALIKELHDNGIYVIGRITDFQDPILAKAHPEWALKDSTTGLTWQDNNHLAWMDPSEQPVRDYLASIAKDAFARGFDEVNFDYIRFASDGALGRIVFPSWNGKTPKATVIGSYFKFLRDTFPNNRISADLFGLATVNNDDLGIGQIIQNAYKYFDYVDPMVYPSHYATGFLGYKYPAAYPYQVIDYSMAHALQKLIAMGTPPPMAAQLTGATTSSTSTVPKPTFASQFDLGAIPNVKLRPWLQDFNLGGGTPGTYYTAAMIEQEKQATYDTLNTPTSSQYYGGWLMWSASNVYTVAALAPKQ